jgi:L-fucose isomerase-like protein
MFSGKVNRVTVLPGTPVARVTLGVIVGNRGFFPSHLCSSGRAEVLAVLEQAGIRTVALGPDATPHGAVESLADARACADLFKHRRDEIDGILVTLPNFGDERAIANTLRWAGLDVPVLVHAFADDGTKMTSSTAATASAGRCRPATTCGSTASPTR